MDDFVESSMLNGFSTNDQPYDPYQGDEKHSKYWRSLQLFKPIRNPKLVCFVFVETPFFYCFPEII